MKFEEKKIIEKLSLKNKNLENMDCFLFRIPYDGEKAKCKKKKKSC
jgi:hypothetical protein